MEVTFKDSALSPFINIHKYKYLYFIQHVMFCRKLVYCYCNVYIYGSWIQIRSITTKHVYIYIYIYIWLFDFLGGSTRKHGRIFESQDESTTIVFDELRIRLFANEQLLNVNEFRFVEM